MRSKGLMYFNILSIIFSLFFFCPTKSIAITSKCLKNLHKQAISDAINSTPIELRNILKPLESKMHREVFNILMFLNLF